MRLTSINPGASPYAKEQKKLESLPCDFPPRCDQFLNHQPFYIPKGSLEACGIEFTNVVQYEGELIIKFPFAYYQGYSCGPSVAEEVAYTNERSEILNQEGLYYHCHAACTGPKAPIDFDAFPTAAASNARRMERTFDPEPSKIDTSCKAKASITDFGTKMDKPAENKAEKLESVADPTMDSKESYSEHQGSEQEASEHKRENQGTKKGIAKRRRLVRAFDLPGYKE